MKEGGVIIKSYSVKEISEMFNTNPETVRRWIRSGKLKATQKSRKSGNYVTEETLKEFIDSTPKYSKKTKGPLAVLGVTAGVLFAEFLSKQPKKNKTIDKKDQEHIIKNNIINLEKSIINKNNMIEQLLKEVDKEKQALEILKDKLKALQ